jgi:large subunit ribosomal protein L17
LRNLVRGLVLNRRIETTLVRAKETSRVADQMVTLAKEGSLAARRLLIARLGSPEIAKLLMNQIAPHFKERRGGYTRVLKLSYRPGDGAKTALVEFSVPMELKGRETKPRKGKKTPEAKPAKAEKVEKEKPEKEKMKEKEKTEGEKRGGFLSKLRKFLTGDEQK